MVFSSFTFLCFFLPAVLLGYYLIPWFSCRNLFLVSASLVFYGWASPGHMLYMLGIVALVYLASLSFFILKSHFLKIMCFWGTIAIVLGGLFFFKYFNFGVSLFNSLFRTDYNVASVVMPIGISFFTFQALSYLIDVCRGERPQKDFWKLLLYISLFPQLIAGPIIKYTDIATQIDRRRHSLGGMYAGFRRFIIGLSKKIIIADMLGMSVDRIFDADITTLSFGIAWIGIIFYVLQLYFDFSGYSDMAIGLGRMFGFKFLENFNYPYVARSISEFWRRWHISLSSWFKEYVYWPLGGNRKGLHRTTLNLFVVFFLTGLWHGANITFVIWGLYQCFFVVVEKYCAFFCSANPRLSQNKGISFLRHAYVLFVCAVGFVFFRSDSLKDSFQYLSALFGQVSFNTAFGISYYVRPGVWGIFLLALLGAFGFGRFLMSVRWMPLRFIIDACLWILLFLCIVLLTVNSYNPFIYFQF